MTHNPDDDGLAKLGNTYFLVRSPVGGATHAINPKTKKTYCGYDMVKLWDKWRPTDVLPDNKHQPTCKICQRHYDDPIKEELYTIKKELEKNADGGLGRFVETVAKFMRSEKKRIKAKKEEG